MASTHVMEARVLHTSLCFQLLHPATLPLLVAGSSTLLQACCDDRLHLLQHVLCRGCCHKQHVIPARQIHIPCTDKLNC